MNIIHTKRLVINKMPHPTKKQLEKALKETLFSVSEKKARYENKKPTQEQLNQKWKLKPRGDRD